MTTPPVVSVTDELIAELEQECRLGADQHAGMGHDYDSRLFDRVGDTLAALLSDRAELKRDAGRYRWLRDQGDSCQWMNIVRVDPDDYPTLDAAIDAAMQP